MELNRREFLELTGSALVVRLDGQPDESARGRSVSVCHFRDDRFLAESIEGYGRVLAATDMSLFNVDVLPGTVRRLIDEARRGPTVLLESGLGTNNVLTGLGVHVAEPIQLWRRGFSPAIPYISYSWPIGTLVRDFSWAVPLSGVGWQQIAHVDDTCVGLMRRVGRGRIVVLGSPLGPVLRGGDREAHEWLAALVDVTARS